MNIKRTGPGTVWIYDHEISIVRSVEELAVWLDVTPTTIRRWCTGAKIPKATQHALAFLAGRINHPNWKNIHVCENGLMWSPVCKRGISASQLENAEMIHQQNRILWHERRKEPQRAPSHPAQVSRIDKVS